MSSLEDFFGPAISVYTTDQAIEDGILVRIMDDPRMIMSSNLFETFLKDCAPFREAGIAQAKKELARAIAKADRLKARGEDVGLVVTVWGEHALWLEANELDGYTLMLPEDH